MASKHVSLLSAFLEWDLTEWFKRFEMELQPVSEASVQVVSATGEPIPVLGLVTLPVQVGPIEVDHPLVVVQSLITPVILGIDFLQAHGLILDFTTTPVHVTTQPTLESSRKESAQQGLYEVRKTKARVCGVQESAGLSEEAIDDPTFGESSHYDMPYHASELGFPPFWTSTVSSFVMYQDKPKWTSISFP